MEWDLLYTVRNLAVADSRKPRQVNLRRTASSAYYAMFHCLVQHCADLIGVAKVRISSATRLTGSLESSVRRSNNPCQGSSITSCF